MLTRSFDPVSNPEHYKRFKIDPIRFLVENFGPIILVAKVIKYVMRYDAKNGVQDIDKAMRCLVMLRGYVTGDPSWFAPPSSTNGKEGV